MFWEMSFFLINDCKKDKFWCRDTDKVDKIHIFDPTIQERQAH